MNRARLGGGHGTAAAPLFRDAGRGAAFRPGGGAGAYRAVQARVGSCHIGFVYRWLPETKGLSMEENVSVFEQQAATKHAAA